MPRNKIDIKKIHPSLNKICTLCGFAISPADVQRTDFEHIRCSNCRKEFVPALLNKNKSAVGGHFVTFLSIRRKRVPKFAKVFRCTGMNMNINSYPRAQRNLAKLTH